LLRTHPVTSNRIAESKDRALQYPPVNAKESLSYALMKERVRVLLVTRNGDSRDYYRALGDNEADLSLAQTYGRGLSQLYGNEAEKALVTFIRLRQQHPEVMAFHTALGQAQLATGRIQEALETLEHARVLAPRNVPVTVRYGEALLQAGRAKRAHEVLLDLFNNVPPTQEQIRLTLGPTRPATGRRLLVHGGVPPDGWRPHACHQSARTCAVGAEHHRPAACQVRGAAQGGA
jgi:predicted Zn-dependent protease